MAEDNGNPGDVYDVSKCCSEQENSETMGDDVGQIVKTEKEITAKKFNTVEEKARAYVDHIFKVGREQGAEAAIEEIDRLGPKIESFTVFDLPYYP